MNAMTPLILQQVCLIGAGNPHNRRIAEAITAMDNCVNLPRYVFSDTMDQNPDAKHFVGRLRSWDYLESFARQNILFANTVSGSTKGRREVYQRVLDAGGRFMDFVHPEAPLPSKMGEGCYLQGDICIQADVEIGDNSTIHDGAVVSHSVRIGSHCFIGAATLLGRVVVADGAFIGAGSTILPDVRVGSWAIVGAGAVVLKDVPPGATVVGNPARIIKVEPIA